MKIKLHRNPLKTKVFLDDRDEELLRKSIYIDLYQDKLVEIKYNLQKNLPISDELVTVCISKEVDELFESYKAELQEGMHVGDCTKFACRCLKCTGEELLGINTLWDTCEFKFNKNIGYELSQLFKDSDNIHSAIKQASDETREWLLEYFHKYEGRN